jgi:hypothetical protein
MIDMLRRQWSPHLSWAELALLTARLDTALQNIREERSIQPPMFSCPACGAYERSTFSHISLNATIRAAGRFGVCSETEAKELSKRWTKYRKAKHLDHYGRKEGITNA